MGIWPTVSDAGDNVDDGETYFDRTLSLTLPGVDARGRLVRLGPVLDTILSAHQYPPAAERVLAESLVLAALLGATLKDDASQITLQAQTENGPIRLLVADYRAGQLRGYLDFDGEKLAEAGVDPSLFALFGNGYLAITVDQGPVAGGDGARYQGIVPLEGHGLADAAQAYFRQSEQLPTFARIAVAHAAGQGIVAGGVLMQQLAAGEVGRERISVRDEHLGPDARWQHVETLASTLSHGELTDGAISLEVLAWRLFHDDGDILVEQGPQLTRGCRCDPGHLQAVVARFPADERADMVGDDGMIGIDCAFCSRHFAIDPAALCPPS